MEILSYNSSGRLQVILPFGPEDQVKWSHSALLSKFGEPHFSRLHPCKTLYCVCALLPSPLCTHTAALNFPTYAWTSYYQGFNHFFGKPKTWKFIFC